MLPVAARKIMHICSDYRQLISLELSQKTEVEVLPARFSYTVILRFFIDLLMHEEQEDHQLHFNVHRFACVLATRLRPDAILYEPPVNFDDRLGTCRLVVRAV